MPGFQSSVTKCTSSMWSKCPSMPQKDSKILRGLGDTLTHGALFLAGLAVQTSITKHNLGANVVKDFANATVETSLYVASVAALALGRVLHHAGSGKDSVALNPTDSTDSYQNASDTENTGNTTNS